AHGLLEPQVLAGLEGCHAELEVRRDRRRDGDRVDGGIAQQVVEVGRDVHRGEAPLDALQLLRVDVRDGSRNGATHLREVPDQVRPPVAVADDAAPDHAAGPFCIEITAPPARMTTSPRPCRPLSDSLNTTTAPAVTRVKVQLTSRGQATLRGSVATTRNHTTLAMKYRT